VTGYRSRALAALLLLGAAACATPARPQIMTEVDRTREGQAVVDTRKTAPQAYARAELFRQHAEQAFQEHDLPSAQIWSEQALAAYLRATVEARLTRAENRLAEARVLEKQQTERLAQLDVEQQRLAAEAADLELRAKVVRDAEPMAKNEAASPEREKARREAARAIVTQGSLLCVAARLVEPNRSALAPLLGKADELRKKLETTAPAPIDDATALRSDCLRELTLARRPRAQANPSLGESDALLSELSRADFLPFRDDRGVVVTLHALREGGKLSSKLSSKLADLGRVAKAHPEFPLLVVSHDARAGAKDDGLSGQAVEALKAAGASRIEVRSAGSSTPVVPPERPGATARNERLEVIFVSPGG
jgi:HEPN domain-containing protein